MMIHVKAIQESFEDRITSTAGALVELMQEITANQRSKHEQAEKGFDGLTYFVYSTLLDSGITDPESISRKIKAAFGDHSNWASSDKEQREIRQKITFALYAQEDDPDKVTLIVDHLLTLFLKTQGA